MSKGAWIFVGILGTAGTLYCGYKWAKTAVQKKVLDNENNVLRAEKDNAVQESQSLKQQVNTVAQENRELKGQVAKLTALPEPPPQTA